MTTSVTCSGPMYGLLLLTHSTDCLSFTAACAVMNRKPLLEYLHSCHAAQGIQALWVYVVQATLQSLLERLAVDHPHHSLYQLFALKNGNRGKDGKAAQAGDVVGGMAVTVDHDKVAAAHDLIAAVAAKPARSALAHCCTTTPCHSVRRESRSMRRN